jgi:hypothetical protein
MTVGASEVSDGTFTIPVSAQPSAFLTINWKVRVESGQTLGESVSESSIAAETLPFNFSVQDTV